MHNTELLKKNLLQNFSELEFEEKAHRYFVNGKPLKYSVSGIIEKFVKPVNFNSIARHIDKRDKLNPGTTQKEWDTKRDKACALGDSVHVFGEHYPFNRKLKPRNGHEEAVVKFWNELPKHIVPVTMELQMFHKEYLFAGTADIILYDTINKVYIIGDYKTNEDLFKDFNDKRLLAPFKFLVDSPMGKYQLQLSFYQLLFEQTGNKVSRRIVVWLKPDGNYQMYDTNNYVPKLKEYLKINTL